MQNFHRKLKCFFGENIWEYRTSFPELDIKWSGCYILRVKLDPHAAFELFGSEQKTEQWYYIIPTMYGYCKVVVNGNVYTLISDMSIVLCMWLVNKLPRKIV